MESARGTEGTRLFERKHEEVEGGGRKDLREKKTKERDGKIDEDENYEEVPLW